MSKLVYEIKKLRGLDRRELVVLKELSIFANKDNIAWPRNRVLADKAGYSVRSVQSALTMLQKLGLIEIKYTGRLVANGAFIPEKRNIYLLTQNWSEFMIKEDEAANSPTIELSVEEFRRRQIKIVCSGRCD